MHAPKDLMQRCGRAQLAIQQWLKTAGATQGELAELARVSESSMTRFLASQRVGEAVQLKICDASEEFCETSTEVIIPANDEFEPEGMLGYAPRACNYHYGEIKALRKWAKEKPGLVFAQCERLVVLAVEGPLPFRTKMCYRVSMTILAETWLLEAIDVTPDRLDRVLQSLADLRTAGLDPAALHAAQDWPKHLSREITDPKVLADALARFGDPARFADRLRNYSFTADANICVHRALGGPVETAFGGVKDTLSRSVEADDGFWANALRFGNNGLKAGHRQAREWSRQLFELATRHPSESLEYAKRAKDVTDLLANWVALEIPAGPTGRVAAKRGAVLVGVWACMIGLCGFAITGTRDQEPTRSPSSACNGKDRAAPNGKDRAMARLLDNGKDRIHA